MSFKVKRWAAWRTVSNLGGGTFKSTGGPDTSGFAYPFAGKIVCGCYTQANEAVWLLYDPASDSYDGPFTGPGTSWQWWSGFYGNQAIYGQWGERWLFSQPGEYQDTGSSRFWGWDRDFNFWAADWNEAAPDLIYSRNSWRSSILGSNGDLPTVMTYTQGKQTSGGANEVEIGVFVLGSGYQAIKRGAAYLPWFDGTRAHFRQFCQGFYQWEYIESGPVFHQRAYDHIPINSDDARDGALGEGSWGAQPAFDPTNLPFGPWPGGTVGMTTHIGGVTYWTPASDPMGYGPKPWVNAWDYRGGELDEYDLDGTYHSPSVVIPCGPNKPISQGVNGWWLGLSANSNPLSFTVYVLDPAQPSGVGRRSQGLVGGVLGWMGDYALADDLSLRHVQPFPDDRDPSGGAMPPQERSDGYVFGRKEIFRGSGANLKYVRDVSIDLSSYGHGDDWWFPGEEGTRHPGFWGMFAGVGPTIIGFMPDPNFGMLDPTSGMAMRFLGAPDENKRASEPAATHVLKESHTLSGASFAAPLAGTLNQVRYMLHSGLDGKTLCYCASGVQPAAPPAWKAVAGTISGRDWHTVVDFGSVTPPVLGQTDWTVWSVVPIPKCRPLPKGGWLVGATLYFAPWAEGGWESEAGTRDATFMGTGNGWVPAKPGWFGPLNTDDHHPILLAGYDEWTIGRSLYGPDALLVYDDEGHYVTCLNSASIHAPDGKEIMVTAEANPKLIFRIYRHGTYSDFAEGYGLYHRLGANAEIQAPLYAVYDLLSGGGLGPGNFLGFVDMWVSGDYHTEDNVWRWGIPDTIYDWLNPRGMWKPPGGAYVRSGKGSSGVTILTPGASSVRTGKLRTKA